MEKYVKPIIAFKKSSLKNNSSSDAASLVEAFLKGLTSALRHNAITPVKAIAKRKSRA